MLNWRTAFAQTWKLPLLPPPAQYGNILIDRSSTKSDQLSVTFSHWSHRSKYTCRVCHLELGFEMKTNATEITEEKNKKGEYCGACHNGSIAFGHTKENCMKCHNGNIRYGEEKFGELLSLPPAIYGNRVDWTESVLRGLLKPVQTLYPERIGTYLYNKTLILEPEWANFASAVFPHEAHNFWLDCSNCHPDIFNIKKKTTKHFSMDYNNKGKFCGTCHLKVAFPLNNCKRCHPELGRQM